MIGLGALANILVNGGWLGALLFATGLFSICVNQYQLLTGQFYRLYRKEHKVFDNFIFNIVELTLMFLCNSLGIVVIALFSKLIKIDTTTAVAIVNARNARLWYQHIAAGIICGVCIQIAVQNYKKDKSAIGVILPVMVFILTGSEHCIADLFYYIVGNGTKWIQIFEVILGNLLGATLVLSCSSDNEIHHLSLVDILPYQDQVPHYIGNDSNVSQSNEDSSQEQT